MKTISTYKGRYAILDEMGIYCECPFMVNNDEKYKECTSNCPHFTEKYETERETHRRLINDHRIKPYLNVANRMKDEILWKISLPETLSKNPISQYLTIDKDIALVHELYNLELRNGTITEDEHKFISGEMYEFYRKIKEVELTCGKGVRIKNNIL
jgi:hypothetical protein